MDQFDQAIEIFRRDGLVLLFKVVDVTVEDFDEEFDGDRGIHTCICDTKGTLETFEDTFAVAVELQWKEPVLVTTLSTFLSIGSMKKSKVSMTYVLWILFSSTLHFNSPPQMTCKVNSSALIWFLKQFTAM